MGLRDKLKVLVFILFFIGTLILIGILGSIGAPINKELGYCIYTTPE